MKLRIRDNTLRLRLTRDEVAAMVETGRVEASIAFGPTQRLVYSLEASADAERLEATYTEDRVAVAVPEAWLQPWADSEEVGFENEQPLGAGAMLRLLVEKDYKCLHRSIRIEEDTNAFPNPAAN